MPPVGFDSNVLVYAEINKDSEKGRRAIALIKRSAGGIIPAQVLGELMRVTQRKAPTLLPSIKAALEAYRAAFRVPATTDAVIAVAAELAQDRKLQFWDSVISVAAAQAGATMLFSEDMQDGSDIRGLKIVNPFNAKNDALIEKVLGA